MSTLTTTAGFWSVDPDPWSIRLRRSIFERTGIWLGRD
jgi:hypothetical protein